MKDLISLSLALILSLLHALSLSPFVHDITFKKFGAVKISKRLKPVLKDEKMFHKTKCFILVKANVKILTTAGKCFKAADLKSE